MKTVILLNPYGTDVTNFINKTLLVPQVMRGTVMDAGDTLYTLPYDNNASSSANIAAGVAMLDAKIRATAGKILVFGYSEGCQIADQWISENYTDAAVKSLPMSFLCIGNADRKYGGFIYGHAAFDSLGYNGGLPAAALPWAYTDFARQYDAIADFPTAAAIQDTLSDLEVSLQDPDALDNAVAAVGALLINTDEWTAAYNAACGLFVHINYFSVTVADGNNLSYTDPVSGVKYVLSPTYPVPILGLSTMIPSADERLRVKIEACYTRPYTAAPATPPPGTHGWSPVIVSPFHRHLPPWVSPWWRNRRH